EARAGKAGKGGVERAMALSSHPPSCSALWWMFSWSDSVSTSGPSGIDQPLLVRGPDPFRSSLPRSTGQRLEQRGPSHVPRAAVVAQHGADTLGSRLLVG